MNVLYQAICRSIGVSWRLYKQYIAGSKTGQFKMIVFIIYLFIFITMKLYSSPILYFYRLSASYFNFNLAYVSTLACIYSASVCLSNIFFKLTGPFMLAKQYHGQNGCYVSPHAHTRKTPPWFEPVCHSKNHYLLLYLTTRPPLLFSQIGCKIIKFPYRMCITNMETPSPLFAQYA